MHLQHESKLIVMPAPICRPSLYYLWPDDPHTNARQTPLLTPEERGLNLDSAHWPAACPLCGWSLAKRGAGLTAY